MKANFKRKPIRTHQIIISQEFVNLQYIIIDASTSNKIILSFIYQTQSICDNLLEIDLVTVFKTTLFSNVDFSV